MATAVTALLAVGCSSGESGDGGAASNDAGDATSTTADLATVPSTTTIPADPGNLRFRDVADEVGLASLHGEQIRNGPAVMLGGVAVADVESDGDLDLYLTRDGLPNRLMLNDGSGTFSDVAAERGVAVVDSSSAPAFADVDADGHLDLLVATLSGQRPYLFMGSADGSYVDDSEARLAGYVAPDEKSAVNIGVFGSAFGDVDRDGDLDLFITMWVPDLKTIESQASLWLNDGTGHFSDVTDDFGLDLARVLSFTPTFSDVNADGWPDLLLAADAKTSRLFLNDGGTGFTDATAAADVGHDENGMGSVVADLDGDGIDDWFVTSTYYETSPDGECVSRTDLARCSGNRLYLGNGDGTFTDGTDELGVRDGGWGWGAAADDLDNDGDLDLIVTNGFELAGDAEREARDPKPGPAGQPESYEATALHDRVRLWQGGSRPMIEVAAGAGIDDDGDGKALVLFDADGDGLRDVVIVNTAGALRMYRNESVSAGQWIEVRLDDPSTANSQGVGARVAVTTPDGVRRTRTIPGGGGYQGQDAPVVHFGLGGDSDVASTVSVEVTWPDTGDIQRFESVPTAGVRTLVRG